MAVNTRFPFTTIAYTNATGGVKTGDALDMNDNPPTAKNIASLCITATLGSGTDSCVIYCQMGFGWGSDQIWGPWHTVEDTAGNSSLSLSTTENQFEANLYAQSWWTYCSAVKIRMGAIGSGPQTIAGSAILLTS